MDEHRQGADSFQGLPLHGPPQDHRLSVSVTQHYTKLTSTSTHWKVRRSIAIGRRWSVPVAPGACIRLASITTKRRSGGKVATAAMGDLRRNSACIHGPQARKRSATAWSVIDS